MEVNAFEKELFIFVRIQKASEALRSLVPLYTKGRFSKLVWKRARTHIHYTPKAWEIRS